VTAGAYTYAADAILLLHFGFVAFVVLGTLLILLGHWRNWPWVRQRRWRLLHLLSIFFVVIQTWLGQDCPLTIWESQLRQLSGGSSYGQSFIAYWLHRILFFSAPSWVFTLAYTAFGLAVAACWLWVKPIKRKTIK